MLKHRAFAAVLLLALLCGCGESAAPEDTAAEAERPVVELQIPESAEEEIGIAGAEVAEVSPAGRLEDEENAAMAEDTESEIVSEADAEGVSAEEDITGDGTGDEASRDEASSGEEATPAETAASAESSDDGEAVTPTETPSPTEAPLPTEQPAAPTETAAREPFWFEGKKALEGRSQFIYVKGTGGSNAELSLYEKNADGSWSQIFATHAYIGKNGFSANRRMGDKTTPSGVFHFTMAFGIADDPGCPVGYTKVNEHLYWVGNSDSPYYNRMVSDLETSDFLKSDSEHLIEYTKSYKYCLNISFNEEQTPDRGAAIFLHCYSKKKDTAGCVAIAEERMKEILMRLHPDCVIAIEPGEGEMDLPPK